LIASLDFKAQFIVARKVERVFRSNFAAKEDLFYDFLVDRLFERVLHRFSCNHIYFAKRGSRDRQVPIDWYDTANYPYNWYNRRNPFDVKKISPL